MPRNRLYVIYNADGTLLGKLRYGYRKLTTKPDASPACAACDITNGGFSFSESPQWLQVKQATEREMHLEVVQVHRDEPSESLHSFVRDHPIKLPAAVLEQRENAATDKGPFKVVIDRSELASYHGDAQQFYDGLKKHLDEESSPKAQASL